MQCCVRISDVQWGSSLYLLISAEIYTVNYCLNLLITVLKRCYLTLLTECVSKQPGQLHSLLATYGTTIMLEMWHSFCANNE